MSGQWGIGLITGLMSPDINLPHHQTYSSWPVVIIRFSSGVGRVRQPIATLPLSTGGDRDVWTAELSTYPRTEFIESAD